MNEGSPNQPAPRQDESNWRYAANTSPQYAGTGIAQPAEPPTSANSSVGWTASEFIEHHKGFGWYAGFTLAAAVLISLAYFITHDIVSVVVVGALALLFAISAARKPRVLPHQLDQHGLTIGAKFYPYGEFKSFSVVQDGAFLSIVLLPMRRFMPAVSVYYEPKDQEHIMEVLATHLPFEQHGGNDFIDRLAQRIRF